jgi:hypothetical protein
LAAMEDMMKIETQRGEEMATQMAALSLKERELEARLEETKDYSSRLSRLVLHLMRGFMDQTQEISLIKFLLTSVFFGAGRSRPGSSDGPDEPPRGSGPGGPPSPSTSVVSNWLDSAFRDAPSTPPPSGPHSPHSEVSSECPSLSFGSAVSSFPSLEAIEDGSHFGLPGVGGEFRYDGSGEAVGGGNGDAQDSGASQYVRLSPLRPLVVSGEGMQG